MNTWSRFSNLLGSETLEFPEFFPYLIICGRLADCVLSTRHSVLGTLLPAATRPARISRVSSILAHQRNFLDGRSAQPRTFSGRGTQCANPLPSAATKTFKFTDICPYLITTINNRTAQISRDFSYLIIRAQISYSRLPPS